MTGGKKRVCFSVSSERVADPKQCENATKGQNTRNLSSLSPLSLVQYFYINLLYHGCVVFVSFVYCVVLRLRSPLVSPHAVDNVAQTPLDSLPYRFQSEEVRGVVSMGAWD